MRVDGLDLEALDRFFESHMGKTYQERIVAMGARHVKACQDRRVPVEEIRAAQGALEAIYAVLALPGVLRKELQESKKPGG